MHIEYSAGQPVVYHSPEYRVMANSPTYDQPLALVRSFSGLGGEQPLPVRLLTASVKLFSD
ncbi:linear amide C-N hydrolase [Mangrovibacter sp. SLW1]